MRRKSNIIDNRKVEKIIPCMAEKQNYVNGIVNINHGKNIDPSIDIMSPGFVNIDPYTGEKWTGD